MLAEELTQRLPPRLYVIRKKAESTVEHRLHASVDIKQPHAAPRGLPGMKHETSDSSIG